MKLHKGISIAAGLLAIAALLPGAARAEAILHGRVSFDTGGVLVKGLEESDWTDAGVNTLVLPNDTLWVDNGGTAEVEFSGGTFLRMADGSKAEIVSLPPNGMIRGWVGSFYLHRLNRSQGDFVFQTPAGAIEIEKDSMVRVDVLEDGITTVTSRWGRATVRTEAGGAVYAYAGKRVFIETGLLPSEPVPFDRSDEDAFDRWNRERAEYLATGSTQTPVEIGNDTLGVTDLDRYGEWVTVDSRPVWRPTVVTDYTPYRYGYWNHVNRVGNVWVGNYPFSYITTHYGYWDYAPRYGWVWSYDRVWSPAWCATVRYGDYFVWAPINRYHRPVYPTTSAHFSIGGVSFGYYGTSIAHVSHLYSGPGYVHFANHDPFRRYYGSGNVNINIWNINTGSRRPHVRVPYRDDSAFTVRDYTPRRSIRGSGSLFASNRSASDRVQRLESSTRNNFSRGGRTGGEFVRTDTARIDRGNRTRNVRLTESAPDYSRASRSNPIAASSTRGRSATDTATRAIGTRDRQTGTRDGAVTSRGGTEVPGIERGVRTSTRGADRDASSSSPAARSRTTTTTRGGTEVPGIERGVRTSTRGGDSPGRTEPRTDFDNEPLRMRTGTPTRTNALRGSEPPPSAGERSQVRTSPGGNGNSSTRSTAGSTRTQVRESSPRVNVAPDRVAPRGSSSASESSRAPRTTTTRPSVSSSRSSTSRSQADPPARTSNSNDSRSRIIERSTPPASRSYTAPNRNTGSSRSTTAPSRNNSSSRSYTAPSRDSSPSRSYTAPSRESSPSRSYTAPSRDSSPSRSYTAPSRDNSSSRSYTAPSRSSNSSRSYTAPSRDSSPSRSYTAPSRSSNSSQSYTAPSRGSSGRDSSISSRSSGSRSVSSGRSSAGSQSRGR